MNRRFEGTPVHIRTTRRYIPEDGNIHNYRCENLKSYEGNFSLQQSDVSNEKLYIYIYARIPVSVAFCVAVDPESIYEWKKNGQWS
jgi:hypothetical protein